MLHFPECHDFELILHCTNAFIKCEEKIREIANFTLFQLKSIFTVYTAFYNTLFQNSFTENREVNVYIIS